MSLFSKFYVALHLMSLLLLSGPLQAAAEQRQTIRFSCVSTAAMPDYQYAEKVYRRAFKSLGYLFEMRSATTAETLVLLAQGAVDGDCGRTLGFLNTQGVPDLVRSETPLRQSYFAAWSLNGYFQPDVLRVSNRTRLRVGYSRGRVFLDALVADMGFAKVSNFDSVEEGLAQMRRGNLDLWLDYEAVFGGDKQALLKNDIRMVGPVATAPVYPFLLKRHAALARQLAREMDRITQAEPYLHDFLSEPSLTVSSGKKIVFGCSLSEKVPQYIAFEKLYRQTFATLGYDFAMYSLPIVRSEAELTSGRVDGNCARTAAFFDDNPDVIKLTLPFPVSFQAWSRDPLMRIDDWKSLRQSSLKLGYVRGTHLLTVLLRFYPRELLLPVNNAGVGMKMLSAGRMDIFVDSAASIQSAVQWLRLQKPLYMVGDVYRTYAFPALRPGLEELRDPLNRELDRLYHQ